MIGYTKSQLELHNMLVNFTFITINPLNSYQQYQIILVGLTEGLYVGLNICGIGIAVGITCGITVHRKRETENIT